jgi:hypothetical protein
MAEERKEFAAFLVTWLDKKERIKKRSNSRLLEYL